MKSYTFTMTRTYETVIEISAEDYTEALKKLAWSDLGEAELHQCNVVDFVIEGEFGVVTE